MTSKRIAVITPSYNAGEKIMDAMMSVDKQIGTDMLITHYVVDDCSTDDSCEFKLDGARDKRIVVVMRTPVNGGPAAARNIAVRRIIESHSHIPYDFVAFLDADDRWEDTHLYNAIRHLSITGADMTYSLPYFKDSNGEKVEPFGIPFYQRPTLENISRQNSIYISSVVMRADCLAVGEFDEELSSIEDWDYWARMLECGYRLEMDELEGHVTYTCSPDGMAGKVTPDQMSRLRIKHPVSGKPIRLNLGCGTERIPGYIACDLYEEGADMKFDAAELPFADNMVDEIRAYHLIEHFTFNNAFKVLREWHRALKPGGILVMETPDLFHTCKKFTESGIDDQIKLYGHFFAWPDLSPGQVHYFLYTESQMMWTLSGCGFSSAVRVAPDSIYAAANPHWQELYLKVVATK